MPDTAQETATVGTRFPYSPSDKERRERHFFVGIALVIALTIVSGFGTFALRGMVIEPVPLQVYVHGALFLAWVGVFVAQTILINRGHARFHRTLGRFALGLAGAMLVAGTVTALESVRLGRVPPFFPDNIFLALSFLELSAFAVLLVSAILLRRQTDWHRRLALGATISLLGPAWGRILPMPLLGPLGGIAVMGMKLPYVFAAMIFDVRTRGKIHPAQYWTLLAVLIDGVGPPLLGSTLPFVSLANSLAPA